MTTIKKFVVPYKWFDKFALPDNDSAILEEELQFNASPVDIFLDIKADTFEYKMSKIVDGQSIPLVWHKLKISEFIKKPGFADQTAWVVNMLLASADPQEVYEIKENEIVDLFSTTLISKPETILTDDHHRKCPYLLFAKCISDTGFLNFDFRITLDEDTEYTFSGPSANLVQDETVSMKQMISPVTLTSNVTEIQADGSATINVSTDSCINEVYLEALYGVLNKTRVKLNNGQGSFKITADGFVAGEQVKVKVGYKKYTGVAEISLPVV